jgi:hypothetical protein
MAKYEDGGGKRRAEAVIVLRLASPNEVLEQRSGGSSKMDSSMLLSYSGRHNTGELQDCRKPAAIHSKADWERFHGYRWVTMRHQRFTRFVL